MEEPKIKCIWVGPSGANSILGTVETGRELELSEDEFDYFKTHKLVTNIPEEKPKKVLDKPKK